MATDVTPKMTNPVERVKLIIKNPLPEETVGSVTQERMLWFFEECLTLVVKKSQGYGDAWEQQGYMGNAARIISKAARVKNLVWRDKTMLTMSSEETVEDTLLDTINLCVFFLLNWREGNRWGR